MNFLVCLLLCSITINTQEKQHMLKTDKVSVFSGTWEWYAKKQVKNSESLFGIYLKIDNQTPSNKNTILGQYIYTHEGRKIQNTFEFLSGKPGLKGDSSDGKTLVLEIYDEKNHSVGKARLEIINEEQNLAVWTLKTYTGSFSLPKKLTLKRMRTMPRY